MRRLVFSCLVHKNASGKTGRTTCLPDGPRPRALSARLHRAEGIVVGTFMLTLSRLAFAYCMLFLCGLLACACNAHAKNWWQEHIDWTNTKTPEGFYDHGAVGLRFFSHFLPPKRSYISQNIVYLDAFYGWGYWGKAWSLKGGARVVAPFAQTFKRTSLDKLGDLKMDRHFVLDELFLEYAFSPSWSVALGRRLNAWSKLDRHWALGLWEPWFRWNPFKPQPMGLPGVWVLSKGQNFALQAYASPMLLPEQGAQMSNYNGQVLSSNPWADSYNYPIDYGQGLRPVHYRIELPRWSALVFPKTLYYAMRFKAQSEHGFWGSLSYAYKPQNKWGLAYFTRIFGTAPEEPGREDQEERPPDTEPDPRPKPLRPAVPIRVKPVVLEHRLSTAELGYKGDSLNVWGSASWEHAMAPKFSHPEWSTELSPEAYKLLWGAYASYGFKHPLGDALDVRQHLAVSYLGSKLYSTHEADLAKGIKGFGLNPFLNTDTLGAEWSVEFVHKDQRVFRYMLEYYYSLGDTGQMLGAELGLWLRPHLYTSFGVRIFGFVEDVAWAGFLSKNRGKDFVHLGVSYVF